MAKIKRATDQEWDELVNRDENSTYFHTREWYDIWAEYDPNLKNDAKLIEFKNGEKILLPLSWDESEDSYISSPEGTAGGFVSNSRLIKEINKELLKTLKKFKSITLVDNPYNSVIGNQASWTGFTQIIDLSPGFDKVYNNFKKKRKGAIKKGINLGVTVEKAQTIEEFKEYFQIYLDSIRRWANKGNPCIKRYDWQLFEIIHNKHSPKIKLWVAKHKGKIIAGAICFYHNNHVVYWHGSCLGDFLNLKGPSVLQYFIIKDACIKGYKWYDFNPSNNLGVIKFKEGFGTNKIAIKVYHKRKDTSYLIALKKIIGV